MLAEFFKAVLPQEGQFCLFLLPERSHTWTDSQDKLVSMVERLGDRTGIYFGTAAFETRATRSQANVLALRSLRLDIDAGEKKFEKDPEGTYPTQRDALAALVSFVKASAIAPSYIVSSGHGLHVYYALDEDLTPDTWTPLATALGQLAGRHELRVDTSVTCDTARILRPVGTKHSEGRTVSVIKATGVVHNVAELRTKLGVSAARPKYDLSVNEDTVISVEGPPSSALKIIEHCQAVAKVAEERGDVQEPLWRAMLGLVKHTVEGDEIGHQWSMGYDGYSEYETQRKLDSWATGPSTCAEFAKHHKGCTSCPHWGKIKSPIVLGRMTTPEIEQLPEEKRPAPPPAPQTFGMPWDGQIPQNFDVVKINGEETLIHYLETERESETGEMIPVRVRVPITHEIFWFAHWADSEGGETAQVTAHKWDAMTRRTKPFNLPTAVLASRSDLAKKLAEFGVQVTTDKRALQSLEHYTKAQMLRIRDLSRRERITDRFGMRILDSGELVAVHGKYILRGNGQIDEASLGSALRGSCDHYVLPIPRNHEGQWDSTVWETYIKPAAQRHVDFMRKHYSGEGMGKYQLAFMLGLASPLMAFVNGGYSSGAALPPNGLSVSLYEREGGKGKTTLMKAVMLAFGRPEELSRDQNAQGSTDLARIAKLSMLGTMPASFDEMGRTAERAVANLVSAVANGSGRERADRTGALLTTSRWALICLVATNRSQRDMVAISEEESAAGQRRLIELDMNNMPEFTVDRRMEFERDWAEVNRDCAGALGALLQYRACAMGVSAVNDLVLRCVDRAARVIDSHQEDRFQYRALGAMLAAQILLAECGMAMFDVKDLVREFKQANDMARAYIQENTLPSDGVSLLARFLHDIRPYTVITEEIGFNKGPTETRRYAVPLNERVPDKIEARYIKDRMTLYVRQQALRDWCRDHKVREQEVFNAGQTAGIFAPVSSSRVKKDGSPLTTGSFNLASGMRSDIKVKVTCFAIKIDRMAKYVEIDLADQSDEPEDEEETTE